MGWRTKNLEGRLAFTNRHLEILGDRIGYSLLDDDRFREVVSNVRAGRDTLAVQLYQDETGSTPGEAVAAIDGVQRLLRRIGWSPISVD